MKNKRRCLTRSGNGIPAGSIIDTLKDIQPGGNEYSIINGDPVKITSQRYPVFQRNQKCSSPNCDRVGTVFYKEKSGMAKAFHLNLYSIDENGCEVLMTKDHIVPKSKGGPNIQSNYITMCTICNSKKRDKLNGKY